MEIEVMRVAPGLVAVLVASACGQQAASHGSNMNSNATAATDCAQPELLLAKGDTKLPDDVVARTKANFATAFGRACVKGLLESEELLDPQSGGDGRLYLFNAPEANVASIYLSKTNGSRMILEFPFQRADGRSRVPSTKGLEEAIYCKVIGGTQEEQETSGRCLPD
jgi:hypothetical protein